ncbi:alcohol dehydrogenase-like regulatory protein ErcA [Geobacter sp.]|uniref:alcohol dehydrogenase-like regulatory protein ErcA n=1 Tax=Geobacter sp. TaxID=46610 RepID=UPI0026322712|nr:alcohol dehydrogenase-like regulatory protein ErcA [Geobacter sp.]
MEQDEFALRKFVAPEFIFGTDARKLVARYAKNFGARKMLLVTDPGVQAAGWAEDVLTTLREAGVEYAVYSSVTTNPKVHEIEEGAEFYRREGCNAIVAVGGGSPMDCAKGIGIVSANKRDIREFEGVDKVELSMPPLICVPTTAGSSADVSQFAIITDTARRVKYAIISKMIVPDVALIDPVTTTTMPRELTADTAMDALCHAIEAFVSTAHSPITDLFALQAIRLVSSNLLPTLEAPDNRNFRGRMMLASLQAGLAFSNTSLGLIHAMAHSLGGMLDSPHGECNALLLPYVIDFNFDAVPDRFMLVGEALGLSVAGMAPGDVRSALHSKLVSLRESAGITHTLARLGVSRSDIPELAEKALNDPCIFTNPRQPTREEIEAIYEKAL